jgi:hypothetical protein
VDVFRERIGAVSTTYILAMFLLLEQDQKELRNLKRFVMKNGTMTGNRNVVRVIYQHLVGIAKEHKIMRTNNNYNYENNRKI